MKKSGAIPIRRLVKISILFLLVGLVAMSGCSKPSTQNTGTKKEEDIKFVGIAGASQGGSNYIQASGMAKIIETYLPGTKCSVEATAGAIENAKLVEAKKDHFGFVPAESAYKAYRGIKPYESALTNLRLFCIGDAALVHVVVLKQSNIKSVADLKGKRVAVGAPGSTSAGAVTPALLEAYGLTYNDITPVLLSQRESCDAFKDGSVDAAVFFTGPPSPSVTEIASIRAIRLLTVDKEHQTKLLQDRPYFYMTTIKGGTYKGVDEDVEVLGINSTIVVHKDVPEAFVYKVINTLWDHQAEWAKVHPGAAMYTPERTAKKENIVLPLHPGVEKALKERGLM